jgi:regulator of sigma E protease
VRSFAAVSEATHRNVGAATSVEVERAGARLSVVLVPRPPRDTPVNEGAMGITIGLAAVESVTTVPVSFGRAALMGVQHAFLLVGAMAQGLGQLVLSAVSPAVAAPEGGVAGPIGIAQLTGEVVRSGWQPFLDLTGFLSLNFALLNFLPLPALDGGRIAFALLEIVRRGRRVRPEREAVVHLAGMAALILLMLVISYFDVVRLLQGRSLLPGT